MTDRIQGVAWEDLQLVLAGVEHGSLTGAAEALRIGQSTASRRLARIEERLGMSVFDRTPEGLLPTDVAYQLLPMARAIEGQMAEIERLRDAHEAAPEGRVRLAVPNGLAASWLVPRLAEFWERFPGVRLDIVSGNAVLDLVRREADLALRFVRPQEAELVARKVAEVPLLPFVHPELQDRCFEELRWIVLRDENLAFVETHWINRHVQPEDTMTVSSWSALFAAVREGLGAALLSPLIADAAGLVPLELPAPAPRPRELYLVYHRSQRAVPRIAALREWLVELAESTFGLAGVVADRRR